MQGVSRGCGKLDKRVHTLFTPLPGTKDGWVWTPTQTPQYRHVVEKVRDIEEPRVMFSRQLWLQDITVERTFCRYARRHTVDRSQGKT